MASGCPEYDRFSEFFDYVTPYRERPDVGFFVDMARESGGPVLELGCGTGRVLIPTARVGVRITGLDLSEGMLDACRTRLAGEPPEVRARVGLVHGDMRRFDLGARYALVTAPFRGFQHLLSVRDQMDALACVARHLEPGGTFVLDLFNPSVPLIGDPRWLATPLREPEFTMPDGRRVVRTMRVVGRDHFEQTQEIEMGYEVRHPDGRVEHSADAFTLRHLFRFEAEHLLERCGFRVEAVYGDYERTPYGQTAYPGELVFVARN